MSKEQQLEEAIVAAKCVAPRLKPQDIDNAIVSVTYTMLPSQKCIICEITLRNGFTVRGESAVVSKENFREELGKNISYEGAREKIWELEGYLLQERILLADDFK